MISFSAKCRAAAFVSLQIQLLLVLLLSVVPMEDAFQPIERNERRLTTKFLALNDFSSSSSETKTTQSSSSSISLSSEVLAPPLQTPVTIEASNIWESLALKFVNLEENPSDVKDFVQYVTLLRVGLPSLALSTVAHIVYPHAAMWVASLIADSGVYAVVSFDLSQYIQNILTTSGLIFSLLVGNTFVFLYQQQEAIYLALFEEVSMAKSLLEQVALVCQGRESLYQRILTCMHAYVHEDLTQFQDPAVMISKRPDEDPLEDILFLTSVGEPSIIYQTVRSLRQARAYRLGALQMKLPDLHMTLLWILFGIVLFTFPLLGAGSQTIGGAQILAIQAWYLSFIVFAMSLTMGVITELRKPGERGAYNAMLVLSTMARGLISEIDMRLDGRLGMTSMMDAEPSIDGDGSFDERRLS